MRRITIPVMNMKNAKRPELRLRVAPDLHTALKIASAKLGVKMPAMIEAWLARHPQVKKEMENADTAGRL